MEVQRSTHFYAWMLETPGHQRKVVYYLPGWGTWSGTLGVAGRPLFVSLSIKTGFTVILNSSSSLLSSHFKLSSLPSSTLLQLLASAHFYKTLQHKNPQALKSCPVEESGAWGWMHRGEETVGRNILLFTPLNHSTRSRRRRWRGGYIVSDGPAD